MKNSKETLYQRQTRFILTYTLRNGTKKHHITLKSAKTMETAESEAVKYLSQYGGMVTSTQIACQKGGCFVLRYENVDGKMKTKTLYTDDDKPVTDKKLAKQLADEFMNGIRRIKDVQSQDELLFKHAQHKKIIASAQLDLDSSWDTFLKSPRRRDCTDKTLSEHLGRWNRFLEFLAKRYPNVENVFAITSDVLDAYFTTLWNSGMSGRTYNAHYQSLNIVLKVAMKDQFFALNPFKNIVKKKVETESRLAFTQEQLAKIFSFLADDAKLHLLNRQQMRIMLMFMVYAGARGQDASSFRWKDIVKDSEGNWFLRFIPRKNQRSSKKMVTVPIHQVLRSEIESLETNDRSDDAYVLPDVAARYKKNDDGIQKDVMRVIEAAGISTKRYDDSVRRLRKGITIYSMHSFRHTFVTLAIENGIPIEVVRDIVGHVSDDMTRHYAHISDQRKFQAIESISLDLSKPQ